MRLDSHSKSRGSGFGIDGHVAHLVDPDEKGVEQWVHPAACKGVGERLESGASEVHGLKPRTEGAMLQGAIGEFRSQVRFAGAAYDEPIFTVAYQFQWFCLFQSCEVDRQAGTLALLEGVERGALSPLHPVRERAALAVSDFAAEWPSGPLGRIGGVQEARACIPRRMAPCRYSQVL